MANLKQIVKHLKLKKLKFEVIDLGSEVFTVQGVKDAGASEEEIVKTLIIRTNDNFVALAVRGKDRLDFKKVRKLFGSRSALAKAGDVLRICKVSIGAVCPILLGIDVYFDQNVMNMEHVHMGSGDLEHGLEMDFADLLKAVGEYKILDLV